MNNEIFAWPHRGEAPDFLQQLCGAHTTQRGVGGRPLKEGKAQDLQQCPSWEQPSPLLKEKQKHQIKAECLLHPPFRCSLTPLGWFILTTFKL